MTINEITSILYATDPATYGDDNKIWLYDKNWVQKHFSDIDHLLLTRRRNAIGRSCERLRGLRESFKPNTTLHFFKVKKGNLVTEFIRVSV